MVSPECLKYFEELGVLDSMQEIGGDSIRETRFFAENGKSVSVPSEWFSGGAQGALGISRSEMDFRLLNKARACGAEVYENNRVASFEKSGDHIESVKVKNEFRESFDVYADLIVDATGRARVLGKLIEKAGNSRPYKRKIKHIAFKTHFENVNLEKGVCEIYFFRGGYGGLSWVENGVANHCFLIDSKVAREINTDADRILNELIFKNKRAFSTMKMAEKKFDWLAVSVEKFGRQPSNDVENLISIGDAAAFIDPFTGSGMLMALESSEILAKLIPQKLDNGRSELDCSLKRKFEKTNKRDTKRRLQVCSVMNCLSFSPRLAGLAISAASRNSTLFRHFASLTRPAKHS